MGWVADKIYQIGLQRLLQDLIDELEQYDEVYIVQVREQLEKTQTLYTNRNTEFQDI